MRPRAFLALVCALVLCTSCTLAEPVTPAPSHVTYEIFVASFADHDGDGRGDLLGIVDQLDYISALGVDALWLMPIHPSPSYHKYDVTDYLAIDPAYGTLADFDTLVEACQRRGIALYLDLVVNHTSREHPWFLAACEALAQGVDSPALSWYNFNQTGAGHPVPNAAGWYYEGQFGDHMPDLNLDAAPVRQAMEEILAFWQGRGVKGFRLDAVTSYYTGANTSTAEFLRFLTETAKANDPDCYLVGEAWADDATILTLYASGIDSLFNFPAADSTGVLLKAALKGNGASVATRLADWNDKLRAASPASIDAPFLTNHDMGRAAGPLRLSLEAEKAAAMLYLLLPGRPTVYYGEELGMTGSGRDENKRLPMVWSTAADAELCLPPAEADQAQRLQTGADAQAEDSASLLNCYRQLIGLRRTAPELLHGRMTALDSGEHTSLALYRVTDGDSAVMVAINASATEALTLDVPELSGAVVLGNYGGAALEENTLVLPPLSCMLLRVDATSPAFLWQGIGNDSDAA